MKVTATTILVSGLKIIPGNFLETWLEKMEIQRRIVTIKNTPLMRLARIQRRIKECLGNLLSLELHRMPSFTTSVKFHREVYIWPYESSSSSYRAVSTDIPDPLSPLLPIVHRLWQVFRATSHILTELLYVCLSWPSCFCSAIYGCP